MHAKDLLDIEENPVHMGNEIGCVHCGHRCKWTGCGTPLAAGFSNDVHHSCTVIFINMKEACCSMAQLLQLRLEDRQS